METKSIKQLSETYLDSVKDETICVYDRYAGYVDGTEMVLKKFEDLVESAKFYSDMSVHNRFYREAQQLIKELKEEFKKESETNCPNFDEAQGTPITK